MKSEWRTGYGFGETSGLLSVAAAGLCSSKNLLNSTAVLSPKPGTAAIGEYSVWLNGERDWELALKVRAK